MRHLLRRLDQGLGTDLTATQKTCVNRKITRDQIAALLTTRIGSADDPTAVVAEFDDRLASIIRQCANS